MKDTVLHRFQEPSDQGLPSPVRSNTSVIEQKLGLKQNVSVHYRPGYKCDNQFTIFKMSSKENFLEFIPDDDPQTVRSSSHFDPNHMIWSMKIPERLMKLFGIWEHIFRDFPAKRFDLSQRSKGIKIQTGRISLQILRCVVTGNILLKKSLILVVRHFGHYQKSSLS